MAAACGMRVVAEGVENQQQLDILKGMGCEFGQGYFWARPAPAIETFSWLETKLVSTK
jgi:EAL domain-containing protein (putative c-di-GMP-specific phosphodiesterase class I)